VGSESGDGSQQLGSIKRLLESRVTFGKWGNFWKVGGLLESGGTFGKFRVRSGQ